MLNIIADTIGRAVARIERAAFIIAASANCALPWVQDPGMPEGELRPPTADEWAAEVHRRAAALARRF